MVFKGDELNILILVAVEISLDLQMIPGILNAIRAFAIFASKSSSVPPVMLIRLPKYVKNVASSMSWLLILMCSLDLLFTQVFFVLLVLI